MSEKLKVFIAGYEGNNKLATSKFLWFKGKDDAEQHYNELKEDLEPKGAIVYKGECILEGNNLSDEEINELVELFLEENDWDKAFS